MIWIIIVITLIVLVAVLCLIPGFTLSIKDKKGHTLEGSIASLEKVNLGGQEQWVLIRGADITKPVILLLHGGPGTSDMILFRRHCSVLEKHFVLVFWDQRGAGKSYSAINPNSSMTINQFVSDACELTKILCHRFNQKKIFLVGHSWGSALGVFCAQQNPDLYYAYIGIGQVANMYENEKLTYQFTLEQAKKANDKHSVKTLEKIGKPPYTGKWQKKFMTQRRLLGKYGGEMYCCSKGAFPLVFRNLICSTEYTLFDKIYFFRGILSSVRLVWPEIMTINLMEQATSLKVPVFFILGRHDFEAPSALAEQYFNSLEAPYKELIWFENSAHLPNIEENDKFNDLMINKVLAMVNLNQL